VSPAQRARAFVDGLPRELRAALHPSGRWALLVRVAGGVGNGTSWETQSVVCRSPSQATVKAVLGAATDVERVWLAEANIVDGWRTIRGK